MFALRGTEAEVRQATLRCLLLWRALGVGVAWGKGSLGPAVDWIGAELEALSDGTVLARVPEAKVAELAAEVARKVHACD